MRSGTSDRSGIRVADLPAGFAPNSVRFPHFPDRLHAYVWRNWQLVPVQRLAKAIGATPEDVLAIGKSMGLIAPPPISEDQQQLVPEWKTFELLLLHQS